MQTIIARENIDTKKKISTIFFFVFIFEFIEPRVILFAFFWLVGNSTNEKFFVENIKWKLESICGNLESTMFFVYIWKFFRFIFCNNYIQIYTFFKCKYIAFIHNSFFFYLISFVYISLAVSIFFSIFVLFVAFLCSIQQWSVDILIYCTTRRDLHQILVRLISFDIKIAFSIRIIEEFEFFFFKILPHSRMSEKEIEIVFQYLENVFLQNEFTGKT